jgi:hypothetical protein
MRDAFFAALRQNPGDWLTRAALADRCEENGLDHTAACVRWMVRHRRRPSVNAAGSAFWFDASQPLHFTETVAHLPAALFRALRGHRIPHYCCIYTDLREAEEDLYAAWAEVQETGTRQPD